MKVLSRSWFVIGTPLQAAMPWPTQRLSGVFCSQPTRNGNALRITGNANLPLFAQLPCNLKDIKLTAVNAAIRISDACYSHFGVVLNSNKAKVTNK